MFYTEFDLIGYDPAIVNALRRILLSDIPSMAIEKVHMYQVTYPEICIKRSKYFKDINVPQNLCFLDILASKANAE